MADLKPKVSTVVTSQLPAYIRGAFEGYEEFVKLYYTWLEQSQNPNYFLHYAMEEKDIDTASSVFADLHAKEFVKNYKNIKIDRKLLVKHIKDFFRAKGSLPSFEMMFEVFYNEPVEVEWGRNTIIKPSDIEPDTKVIIYLDDVTGDLYKVEGSFLYQPSTGVRGFVDTVALVTVDGNSMYQVHLDETKLSGKFVDRVPVWAYYREDLLLEVGSRRIASGTVQSIVGGIEIINPGIQYKHGDPIEFIGGTGTGALAYVDEVTTGGVSSIDITRTGTGYYVGDKVYNHQNPNDLGEVVGEVTRIDGYGAVLQPVLSLDEYRIVDPGTGYQVGDILYYYPNPKQAAILKVTETKDTDLIYDVKIIDSGVGYRYVTLAVIDNNSSLMKRIWCQYRSDSRGALQDIVFDYRNLLNAPVPWLSSQLYAAGDEYSYGSKWYRVLYGYTSGGTFGSLDTLNTQVIGPRLDGYDLDGYASQIFVNGANGDIHPVVSGGVITSWVVSSAGVNYVKPKLVVNGTVTGNAITINSTGAIQSVSGTYGSGIPTVTSTISGTAIGSPEAEVAVADIGKWREGWYVYSATAFPSNGNVARISSISYNTISNKYNVIFSHSVEATVTSITIQQVSVETREEYGYGATVVAQYKTGAIREFEVLDSGKFTAIDTLPFISNGYNSIDKTGTFTYSAGIVTITYANHRVYPGAVISVTLPTVSGSVTSVAQVSQVLNSSTFRILPPVIPTASGSITFRSNCTGTGFQLRGYYTITDCNLVNPGVGYTVPEITLKNAFGSDAVIQPVVANDCITNISLSSGGSGYVNPVISVSPDYGHGFGFVARCQLNQDGTIVAIEIDDPGQDYIDITASDLLITGINSSPAVISSVTTKDTTIRKFEIYNGGKNYYHDIVIQQTGGPGSGSTFKVTVTDNGVVKDIQPTAYGTGYTENSTFIAIASDKLIYHDMASDLWIPFVDMYWPVFEAIGKVDLQPRFDLKSVAGTGISKAIVNAGGFGYWTPTEVPPLAISVIDTEGSGAQLLPLIDDLYGDANESPTRAISGVIIIRGGQNYSENTVLKLTGGLGSGAILIPIIENGEIVDVYIQAGGGSYYYGTKLHIIGDGNGASLTPVINTGVTLSLLGGGSGYTKNNPPVLYVNDTSGKGKGARFKCVVGDQGSVIDIVTVSPGTGYISPEVLIAQNGGSGLDITPYVSRHIENVILNSQGSGYTTVRVYVQGDGSGATIDTDIAREGITKVTVPYGGTRISSYPTIEVVDTSNLGKISQVTIRSTTNNFKELPSLYIESLDGVNGEVIARSNTIGKVQTIKVVSPGYGYETKPYISTPIIVRTSESSIFKRGEIVYDPTFSYPIVNGKPDYIQGPHGYVTDFEPNKNLVKISPESESITILSETGVPVVSEGVSVKVATEASFLWSGKVMSSVTRQPLTIPFNINRCSGIVDISGQFQKTTFNLKSLLNDPGFKLHNNKDVQEYAYTILAGLDVKEYKQMVKEYLHPAGYEMSGKIKFSLVMDASMNHEMVQDIEGGSFLINIEIDLTDEYQRGYTPIAKKEFTMIITFDNESVQINFGHGKYNTTTEFARVNAMAMEPSYYWDPVAQKSNPNVYVPYSEHINYYPPDVDSVTATQNIKDMIMNVLGRPETVAAVQAAAALVTNPPAATPIQFYESLTIPQMENSEYSLWKTKQNWARDTTVFINHP